MASTVVGLFDLRDDAQSAVQNLINAGYDRKDISVVAADTEGHFQNYSADSEGNLAGDGAVSGATSGAIVGGIFGLLIGAGALAFPAVGLVAIGPLSGLLTGAGIGAVSGGVIGALIGLGIPEEHANLYAEGVRRGGTLLSVYAGDGANTTTIEDILDRAGAVDINERGATYRDSGFTKYDHNQPFFDREQAEMERNRYRTDVAAASVGAAGTGNFAYADSTGVADTLDRNAVGSNPSYGLTGNPSEYDTEGNPSFGLGNGIQTGGHATDGTPDTRGITEKIADAVTGDHTDDKTGKTV